MLVRSVAKNKDGQRYFVFGRGLTSYKSGQNAIMQDVEASLLEFENDCYWALDSGIDWRTRLGYSGQKKLLDNDVYNTISERYGVLNIEDFETLYDSETRNYIVKCNIYTIYSENAINFTFSKGV